MTCDDELYTLQLEQQLSSHIADLAKKNEELSSHIIEKKENENISPQLYPDASSRNRDRV